MITLRPITIHDMYPLWEFDYPIADDIHAAMHEDSNWAGTANNELISYSKRWSLRQDIPLFDRLIYDLEVLQKDIADAIFEPGNFFQRATFFRWPNGVSVRGSTQIIKDLPSFNMIPHMDNRNVFAAVVLNFTDNPCSTQFYMDNQLIHTGPTKRGTGLVFLNTEYAWHSISNTSDQPRYISFMNLTLQMQSDYRFTGVAPE